MSVKNNAITDKVRTFYEGNPYPGLGDTLMMSSAEKLSPYFKGEGKVLFPGCGTGHGIVSMAKLRPDLECYGMDLSAPSLEIANQLAKKYGVNIKLSQGNYMEKLPWDFKFQYITLQGTLHHTADPKIALKNVVGSLEQDGLIHVNLYGKKYHTGKFEIIEMLDLLQADDTGNLQQRFELFKALQDKLNDKNIKDYILDFSLRTMWRWFNAKYSEFKNKINKTSGAYPWHLRYDKLNQIWIDHFSNPNEKTYDIWETKELVEYAGLEVVDMMSLGKIRPQILPDEWLMIMKNLNIWSQYRIMELISKEVGSVNFIARKVN